MIKKILSLFLILIAVGAGLCSAQTAGKKYYLVDGLFFEGMPPCVSSDNVQPSLHMRTAWDTRLRNSVCAKALRCLRM